MESCKKIIQGKSAEKAACHFLQQQGLRLLNQNYHCAVGEIDLIMRDGNDVVFVEVRSKQNLKYGTAVETVTYYKQQKIIKTALHFLQKQKWLYKINCRFDVIGIHLIDNEMKIDWIKNAFSIDLG